MNYKDFFEKAVDGYLLSDLLNMSKVYQKKNQKAGALGYPMIATVCSGIELLGGILQPNDYQPGISGDYFRFYYENYLSVYDDSYRPYESVFWSLVRNGIAHTYITKPSISVTKTGKRNHLVWWRDAAGSRFFNVDCLQLYEDFKASYDQIVKPIINTDGEAVEQIQKNISLLLAAGRITEPEGWSEEDGESSHLQFTTPSGVNVQLSALITQSHSNIVAMSGASLMRQEEAEALKNAPLITTQTTTVPQMIEQILVVVKDTHYLVSFIKEEEARDFSLAPTFSYDGKLCSVDDASHLEKLEEAPSPYKVSYRIDKKYISCGSLS